MKSPVVPGYKFNYFVKFTEWLWIKFGSNLATLTFKLSLFLPAEAAFWNFPSSQYILHKRDNQGANSTSSRTLVKSSNTCKSVFNLPRPAHEINAYDFNYKWLNLCSKMSLRQLNPDKLFYKSTKFRRFDARLEMKSNLHHKMKTPPRILLFFKKTVFARPAFWGKREKTYSSKK